MIADAVPEDTVFPDSIHRRGYFNIIKYTCPNCHTQNETMIPAGSVEKILIYCPACGDMLRLDFEGMAGGDGYE